MFDLDGTLIDSVPDLSFAIDQMLSDLGLPKAGEERVRTWVGNGAAKLVQRALEFSGTDADVLHESALKKFFCCYESSCTQNTVLYPGVLEALSDCRDRDIARVVITNKPRRFIAPILQALNIDHFFQYYTGGDDLPNKKPHPEPLIVCMKQLGFSAAESLMVGDSRNDIEAARRAKVLVAAVDYGYNHGTRIEDENPDFIVSSINQVIPELMLSLNKTDV
jgi:phosphoglycolate phosphatase